MATLSQVYEDLYILEGHLKKLFEQTLNNEYEFSQEVEVEPLEDSEEIFLAEEALFFLEKLFGIYNRIQYLRSPIKGNGILHKTSNGYYQTDSGKCYMPGAAIETLINDNAFDIPYWVLTSIKDDGSGCYLVDHESVRLEGLQVRWRDKILRNLHTGLDNNQNNKD